MMRNRSRSMRQELQLSIPSALNEQLFASGNFESGLVTSYLFVDFVSVPEKRNYLQIIQAP